ncbi:acyl carrier protein [Shimia sp.]|uniref:acyl carrier protein n=1 Tax=Shimia sp. TaxID=1954381 RepID=UPI0035629E55
MTEAEFDILRKLVLGAAKSDLCPADLPLDLALFEDGLGMDSFAVVDLVMGVEGAFGVQFREADFVVENFADIRAIAALVGRRRSGN